MDNYEKDYNEAMKEVRRLRGVAREYADFYEKVKAAFENQNWELIEKALKESE